MTSTRPSPHWARSLLRDRDGTYLETAYDDAAPAVRALAFAGVRATEVRRDLGPPAGTRVASGRAPVPLPSDLVALDIVRVHRLSPGEATAPQRGQWPFRKSGADRRRRRALLRGDLVVLAWQRHGWARAQSLRAPAVRPVLRPVVFDRAPLALLRERRVDASAGALRLWALA